MSALQVRKYKGMMLEDLENALAEHAPAGGELASELPPLTIDGIPVSVDKMTQVRSSVTHTSKGTIRSHYTQSPAEIVSFIKHLMMSFVEVLPVCSLNLALQISGLHISSGLQVASASKDEQSLLVQLALLCRFTATLTALAISALCPPPSPRGNPACLPCLPSAADASSGSSSKQPAWQRPSETSFNPGTAPANGRARNVLRGAGVSWGLFF